MIVIKEIKPDMTYDLRHRILRPHQPYEECMYETDHDPGAFHIGAFLNEELITIASFYKEGFPDFPGEKHYRLRAMATLDKYRMLGAGRKAVIYAENKIKEMEFEVLWCKGRTTVQAYYEKLGFIAYGDVFDYPPIGPHIIMYKKL
jgi:predicted GNAT family N-acyltransferase